MNLKKWVGPLIVAVVMVAAGVVAFTIDTNRDYSKITLNNVTHTTTVLRTPEELQKGLSGSESLPEGQAMVFVFPRDEKWGIWMKDMNYPIDIVWLDSGRTVVHLVKNAQPSSYPSTTFSPSVNSRYVIELPSGTIERTGIAIGDPAGMPSGV